MLTNSKSILFKQAAGLLLMFSIVACGGSSGGVSTTPPPTTPTVMSNAPLNGASDVPITGNVSATFSEAMDSSTLNASTFKLTSGEAGVPVKGNVTYANSTAVFWPTAQLENNRTFTATITTGAKSASGIAMPISHTWIITTIGGESRGPIVLSNTPPNGATGVPSDATPSATFSEAMDPTTLTTKSFTLTYPRGTSAFLFPVQGTVTYANLTAVFWPSTLLPDNTTFTATITTTVKSAFGVPVRKNFGWSFTVGHNNPAPELPVNLGTAGNFVILAKSGISTVPTSAITGNLGVSPAAASFITGFALNVDASNVFSTSTQVTGKVYAANYTPPAPSNLTTAVGDMELAFTDAAGRAPDVTELGAGNIGGMTLVPGVYKWGTGLLIPTNVSLNGSATSVWIFQITQDLTMSNGAKILLAGGALPKNIFWQVSGGVNLGTTAHIEGIVLTKTLAALQTGASINGRLLAQTAVTLDSSTVVQPAP